MAEKVAFSDLKDRHVGAFHVATAFERCGCHHRASPTDKSSHVVVGEGACHHHRVKPNKTIQACITQQVLRHAARH